jgi:hypothetical protein
VPRGKPPHRECGRRVGFGRVSLFDVPSLVANMSMGGMIAALGPRGATSHGLPFVVCVVLQGYVWVFYL